MRASKLYFIIFLIMSGNVFSQTGPPVAFPTPNAASLGTYGQIPVNYFNGLAAVNIPIHTISEKDINIPIELSYQALGVRPDSHPGWVGLNWNLSAGGMITRITNGQADEVKVVGANTDLENTRSYLFNFNALDNSDWTTATFLGPLFQRNVSAPWAAHSATPSPDEFSFNFNGYSGSFFLDHKGKWKVRSANARAAKISVTTNSFDLLSSPAALPITLGRIIDKINLTMPDGITYVFGGTNESIEFSRNEGEVGDYYNAVTATSWMLTKIIPPNGDVIILNYERGGYAVVNSDSWTSYYYYIDGPNGTLYGSSTGSPKKSLTLLNPVYLKEIVTPGQTVSFTRVRTHELAFPDTSVSVFTDEGKPSNFYRDIGTEGSNWSKLTNIKIKDNFTGNYVKQFDFTYKDQPDSRLMLTAVQEKDGTGLLAKNPYKFYYYDSQYFDLPGYISRKVDHWGFFNNYSFFEHDADNKILPSEASAYAMSRDANSTYLNEGSLSHIFYPTGGQTEFVYEANEYSSVINSYNTNPIFSLTKLPNGQKKIAGGLRIKKITSKTGDALPNVREFFYNNSSDSYPNSSSGILGGNPVYFEDLSLVNNNICVGSSWSSPGCRANGYYWYFSNHATFPLSFTNGNHVTYSEVKEKFADGSYKIYNYSNHDSVEYRNKPIINSGYYFISSLQNIKVMDMSYVRGKLLHERSYSSANKLLERIKYKYNSNTNRFNDNVRVVDIIVTASGGPEGAQLYAYNKYLFEPFLSEINTESYNQGDNNYLTSVKKIDHVDSTNLIKSQIIVKSDGRELKTSYKYPTDKLTLSSQFTTPDLSVIDQMISKHIISPVVEAETFMNSTLLKRESTIYKKNTFGLNDLFLPSVLKSRQADAAYDNIEAQYEYDNKGNISVFSSNNSSKTSFKWDYNQQYPIAKVSNAASGEFFYEGFESSVSGSVGNAHTGDKKSNGTYQVPFVRPNSRLYTLSYWKYSNNHWVQQTQDYTTDNFTINVGMPIDDVCIYPKDALLAFYTYKPLIGMSSETNFTGNTKYYSYDKLGRLVDIKDLNQNIIKSYSYNYANTTANWQNTSNITCEYFEDPEYSNNIGTTGNKLQEQIDINPFSFTYNQTRKIVLAFDQTACPPAYYFIYVTDPGLTSVTINAKRSYDDGSNKTMKFRVRYDALSNGQQMEQFVTIPITASTGTTTLGVQAGSYIEVELSEIY